MSVGVNLISSHKKVIKQFIIRMESGLVVTYQQLDLMTFPKQTCGVSDSRVKISALQESRQDLKAEKEADCFLKLCDCLPVVKKKIVLNGYSLKMLRIYYLLGGFDFLRVLLEMEQVGYFAEWQVLNSKDFGVPQNRERVFIVGHLGAGCGREVFPVSPTDGENTFKLKERTIGQPQGNRVYDVDGLSCTLSSNGGGAGAKTGLYAVATPARATKKQYGRRIKEAEEPMFTITTQDIHRIAIKEATKKGYAMAEDGDSVNIGMPDSKTRRGRVGKQIANTLTCANEMGVVNGVRIRRLTPKECWRLQGFPDEYIDKAKATGVSDTQLYKQAGNAVTVNVARAIGEKLKEIEEESK